MTISKIFRSALVAVFRNKTRAALTTLGIIIGIGAVIAMMEIGNGSAGAIQKTIASMGANNVLLMPGTAASGGVSFGSGSVLTLTPQDSDAIARDCPAVLAVAPTVRARTTLNNGNKNWVPQSILGTTPSYLQVRDWEPLADGEPITDRDVRSATKVCLVGQTIVRELFGGQSPVGKEIRIQSTTFKVIGVLTSKGANMMGSDQDDIVIAPWTTIKYRVSNNSSGGGGTSSAVSSVSATTTASSLYSGSATVLYPAPSATQQTDSPRLVRFTNVDQITFAAASAAEIPAAMTQVTDLIRERHRIRPGEPDDFQLRDMTEMTKAVSSTSTLMTRLLLFVAMVSLVVGGVGIMNIMLVSVTERTREIGLRMAVGARSRDILRQFLVEAVLLCLTGGAIGIMLGRGTSYLVSTILKWPTAASLTAIIAAVAVSVTVGVVFGFYPAWKASRLDPIVALRYE